MDKVNESILSETILEDMKENRIDHMTYLEGMEVLDSDVEKTVVDAMNAYDYDSYTAADVRRARFCSTFVTGCPSFFGRNCTDGTEGDKETFW